MTNEETRAEITKELEKLRREIELCSLGDRPQSPGVERLQRMSALEKELAVLDRECPCEPGQNRESCPDCGGTGERASENDGEEDLPLPTGPRPARENLAWMMSGMPKVGRTAVDLHVFDGLRAEVNALREELKTRDKVRDVALSHLHKDPYDAKNTNACGCIVCIFAREVLAAMKPEPTNGKC